MQTTSRERLDLEWKSARIIISSFLHSTYYCLPQYTLLLPNPHLTSLLLQASYPSNFPAGLPGHTCK
jgi:hypothetical protein